MLMEFLVMADKVDPCERLLQFFNHHGSPSDLDYLVKYDYLVMAELLLKRCPHNQELTLALRALQESKYYALEAMKSV